MSAATSENDRYPRLDRDAVQGKVATDPTVAARGGRKRLAFDNCGGGAHAPSRVVRDASSRMPGERCSTRGRVEPQPGAAALPI